MRLLAALLVLAGCIGASVAPVASADAPIWLVGKPTWLYTADYQCSVFDRSSRDVGQAGFLMGYAVAAMTFYTPGLFGSTNPMTLSRFTQAMAAKCEENPNRRLIDVTKWIMTGTPIQ